MALTNIENEKTPLLEVEDFALTFRLYKKGLREQRMQVVRKLNMTINKGEVVAVIGASGSGKSLLADAILGILPENAITEGKLHYQGKPLTRDRQKKLRGNEISLIPQSVNALNPLMKVGKQIQTALKHSGHRKALQRDILQKVNLNEDVANYYPFQLSGGMARKVLSAIALVGHPELIIADEPTPGLDSQSLQEVTSFIRSLADDGKGVMFITHDIDTALKIADTIVIMNKGETIETVQAGHFNGNGENLKESYTNELWNARNQILKSNYKKKSSPSPGDKSLQIRNLNYSINGKQILEDINFDVLPGEVVGLMGESGAGKTTLARIIAGHQQADGGSVKINGHEHRRGRNPIQLVGQHPEQFINPKWTMGQVLEESGMLDSEVIHMLGIQEEWLSRWPSELSGGELQRFSIVRALHPKTKFLILDEITTMLDAISTVEIWSVVLKVVKQRNIGLLAISHDKQLLNQVCHRILDFHEL